MRSISNVWTSIQATGFRPYCVYQLGRVLKTLSIGEAYHYCIMAVDIQQFLDQSRKREAPKLVAVKRGDPRLESMDAPMEILLQRFDAGAMCLGLAGNGALRSWIWLTENVYEEDEVRARFELPQGIVWDFGAYVVPQYRVGRSFDQLWRGVALWCNDRSITFSLSRIGTHNVASMRAHARLPHLVLGHCTFIRIFSLQICLSPLLPKWHFSKSDMDKPVFQVRV